MKLDKRYLVAGVMVVGLIVGGMTWASAHGGDTSKVHACVDNSKGTVRIVGANDSCTNKEHPLDWAITGPAGPPGPEGPAGPAGPASAAACPPEPALPAGAGAVDAFLELDGIEGESADAEHPDEIEVQSLRTGVTGAESGICGAGEEPVFDHLVVGKAFDRSSVPLLQKAADGSTISQATLVLRKAGGDQFEFLEYELTDVQVARSRTVWNGGIPTEEVSFSFGTITWRYTMQSDTGGAGDVIVGCWNVDANAAC